MSVTELCVGGVCYASKVSLHFEGVEAVYNAPKGRKFALILIGDDDVNKQELDADEFLKCAGWEFKG